MQQIPPKDPAQFELYLSTVEREVDKMFKDPPEKRSALFFFVKLQHEIQREMYNFGTKLPETRVDTASLARHCWGSFFGLQNAKLSGIVIDELPFAEN